MRTAAVQALAAEGVAGAFLGRALSPTAVRDDTIITDPFAPPTYVLAIRVGTRDPARASSVASRLSGRAGVVGAYVERDPIDPYAFKVTVHYRALA
jgi:hypothetical protein